MVTIGRSGKSSNRSRRQIRNGRRSGELFFWRDRTKEVDFLIHRGGRFELYDAKWAEHPGASEASALERVRSELPRGTVLRSGLVCRTRNPYPVRGAVEALPVGAV